MRKRIWVPLVVVLAVCLLLLLKTKQHQQSGTSQSSEALTSQPGYPESAKVAASNTARITAVPSIAPAPTANAPVTNGEAAAILAAWQTPIEFYGKAIDEKSNAVAGAQISFDWVETPTESGNRRTNTESDAEGLFSLHGQRGPNLGIVVSKEGYYPTSGGARYGPFGNPDSHPDPRTPVIFQLHKKGKGELLITTGFPPGVQIAQLHHDGTPVELDLLKGAQVSVGSGQLKLEFWRDISNKNANTFDWKLQLSVPGGGLIETDEEFAFEAPENGYQPSVVIDMPATNQTWIGTVRNKYYIQLPDGKYGRIDFYILTDNGVFTVQSAINPSGSRNLEPMETKSHGGAPPPPGVRMVIPEFK